jgi:cobalt-precorrin 5A hydrolase/precorrin-3B C17-methyltransferase
VADGDFAVALYNPRSARRTWQLTTALAILLEARPATTPVGIVTDATRPGQDIVHTTLTEVDPNMVGMRSIVIVGSSTTTVVDGHMVTPRGYET